MSTGHVCWEHAGRALSAHMSFFNRSQMCGHSASRPRRREAAHLRSAGVKRL
ncbi:unnamed protein product, partial [Staurois parvus]